MVYERKKPDLRFNELSQKELSIAQNKLNKLCEEYNIPTWNITTGRNDWRELILRMIGIPGKFKLKKPKGRPARSEAEVLLIGKTVDIIKDFRNMADKTGYEESYELAAKKLEIKPTLKNNGEYTKPIQTVKSAYRQRYKKIIEEDFKYLSENYNPDDQE